MSSHPDAELAAGVMDMAYGIRSKPERVMFHSDPRHLIWGAEIQAKVMVLPDNLKHESTWKLLG